MFNPTAASSIDKRNPEGTAAGPQTPQSQLPSASGTGATTTRPYRTRERLYYETDYIKGGPGGLTSSSTGSSAMFEPFLKQTQGANKEDFSATAPEDLPPTTSLYEFMFSPSKAGDATAEPAITAGGAEMTAASPKVQLSSLSAPEAPQPITKAVTVFGFPPSCRNEIVSAFASFGPIEQYDFGESNWLHIIYESEWAAQKALSRNGSIFNPGGMMIGVVPMQAALERVSAAADSFMSPLKGELDKTRPATQSIFKSKAKDPENTRERRTVNLPDDSSLMTKAVNYLFKW